MDRAGSWSLQTLRLESDCGPFVKNICNIDLKFLVSLPSVLLTLKTIFHNLLQNKYKCISGMWFTTFKHCIQQQ